MIHRALVLLGFFACAWFSTCSPLDAGTENSSWSRDLSPNLSGDSAVQALNSLRNVLAMESVPTPTPGNPYVFVSNSLPSYFAAVAQAYRGAGYSGIAHVFAHSGARTFDTIVRRKSGLPLQEAFEFSHRLKRAIVAARMRGQAPLISSDHFGAYNGSFFIYTIPDYLQIAAIFNGNLSHALNNVAANRPATEGIESSNSPLTLTVYLQHPN
jgi:hypothetical protein